jgi:pyruvate kinase
MRLSHRRTKIVCTLGPSTDSKDRLLQMMHAGMNVARLNCSHGGWEEKRRWIEWIRELSPEVAPPAILADLQGPKFRIGPLRDGDVTFERNQEFLIGRGDVDLQIPDDAIWSEMRSGSKVIFGDGDVEAKLTERKSGDIFLAKALTAGTVKSRQGITLVGRSFDVPPITEKDREDIKEACAAGVDYIALSYVRNASDLRELRRTVDACDKAVRLVAKVETREAAKEIDDIIRLADGIMVARGDMGLQMDIEEVPIQQKRIIRKCVEAGKPVITATQMLESMVHSPRPTRAEASDVANAILDGTSAVMLSGETAIGRYPVETVRTMGRVVEKAESIFDPEDWRRSLNLDLLRADETAAVAHSAVLLAHLLKAKAIITTTTSGTTPRLVSKFRPSQPILCACWSERVRAQLALAWGVNAISIPTIENTDQAIQAAIDAFLKLKAVKIDDQVVVTAGYPPGEAGNTNLILVETVQ